MLEWINLKCLMSLISATSVEQQQVLHRCLLWWCGGAALLTSAYSRVPLTGNAFGPNPLVLAQLLLDVITRQVSQVLQAQLTPL